MKRSALIAWLEKAQTTGTEIFRRAEALQTAKAEARTPREREECGASLATLDKDRRENRNEQIAISDRLRALDRKTSDRGVLRQELRAIEERAAAKERGKLRARREDRLAYPEAPAAASPETRR